VRVTRNTIVGLSELVAQHGNEWLTLAQRADAAGLQAAGREFALDFASAWREPAAGTVNSRVAGDSSSQLIDFRGYAYTRKPSAISGGLVTTYDPTTPQIWRVPFRKNTTPSLVVKAPQHGYIVPAAFANEVAAKLELHGIASESFKAQSQPVELEAFRVSAARFSSAPFEGRMRVTLGGEWRVESREVPAGSLLVPIAQHRSRLAMTLLEPQAPDSLAAWGFFNGCFEHKEYMEPYVAEVIAREMMATNLSLATEFEHKLKTEPSFAASPSARLEFFLRRHSSWDERMNLYPIYRC
jgi:hypothetical protein